MEHYFGMILFTVTFCVATFVIIRMRMRIEKLEAEAVELLGKLSVPPENSGRAQALKEKLGSIERRLEQLEQHAFGSK